MAVSESMGADIFKDLYLAVNVKIVLINTVLMAALAVLLMSLAPTLKTSFSHFLSQMKLIIYFWYPCITNVNFKRKQSNCIKEEWNTQMGSKFQNKFRFYGEKKTESFCKVLILSNAFQHQSMIIDDYDHFFSLPLSFIESLLFFSFAIIQF